MQTPSIFIMSKDLRKTVYSQPMADMVEELRKELNNDKIDLSNLHSFTNKSSKLISLKFKKEDFILPTAFPWRNRVVLIHLII